MKEITFKQIGLNVILVIEGEKFSKKIEAKEDREKLKAQVEAYNKKPTAKALKIIQTTMTANTVEAKKVEEKEKVVKQAEQKLEKKKSKVVSKDVKKEVKEIKKVVEKGKDVSKVSLLEAEIRELKKKLATYETKPVPQAESRGRREY